MLGFNMKKLLISFSVITLLLACGQADDVKIVMGNDTIKPVTTDSSTTVVIKDSLNFKAAGTKPDWYLEVWTNIIKFKPADKDTILASDYAVAPVATQDGKTEDVYTGGKDFGFTVTDRKDVTIHFQGKTYKGKIIK